LTGGCSSLAAPGYAGFWVELLVLDVVDGYGWVDGPTADLAARLAKMKLQMRLVLLALEVEWWRYVGGDVGVV
jgi:hypothetical protein